MKSVQDSWTTTQTLLYSTITAALQNKLPHEQHYRTNCHMNRVCT